MKAGFLLSSKLASYEQLTRFLWMFEVLQMGYDTAEEVDLMFHIDRQSYRHLQWR